LGGGCGHLQNLDNHGASIKKQIITAFEPMYLEIINNGMVGFANTTARDMLHRFFISYGIITDVDLEHNLENMCQAWDPQQPVESLFKQIQDCVDYAEAGGVIISEAQKLQTAYTKIFATGIFHTANARGHSFCLRVSQRSCSTTF
jgi:hypothetical protein